MPIDVEVAQVAAARLLAVPATSASTAVVGTRMITDTNPSAGTSASTASICASMPPALLQAATTPVVRPRMRSGKLSAV